MSELLDPLVTIIQSNPISTPISLLLPFLSSPSRMGQEGDRNGSLAFFVVGALNSNSSVIVFTFNYLDT